MLGHYALEVLVLSLELLAQLIELLALDLPDLLSTQVFTLYGLDLQTEAFKLIECLCLCRPLFRQLIPCVC